MATKDLEGTLQLIPIPDMQVLLAQHPDVVERIGSEAYDVMKETARLAIGMAGADYHIALMQIDREAADLPEEVHEVFWLPAMFIHEQTKDPYEFADTMRVYGKNLKRIHERGQNLSLFATRVVPELTKLEEVGKEYYVDRHGPPFTVGFMHPALHSVAGALNLVVERAPENAADTGYWGQVATGMDLGIIKTVDEVIAYRAPQVSAPESAGMDY
ncbi:hypothetical protein ACFL1B_02155 [Nanoarchaeota archaeon]